MTILDREVTAKNKEETGQSRKQNHDNGNRKQKSRSGHSGYRPSSQHRSGQVSPANDFNFWRDPMVGHRNPRIEVPPHEAERVNIHEDLALRNHLKPRGLSKSSAVPTQSDSLTAMIETTSNEMSHSVVDGNCIQLGIPKISQTSDMNMPSSSQPVKNSARHGKKSADKKISHKKKNRRSAPYGQSNKLSKSHMKTSVQVHRVHLQTEEIAESTDSNTSAAVRPYGTGTTLGNENPFIANDMDGQYKQFPNEATGFLRAMTVNPDKFSNISNFPKSSHSSPSSMLDTSCSGLDKNTTNEVNDAKHNSDDEYDQNRLQKLHRGVDFKTLESEFEEKLKKVRGFIIRPMGEDGACLFRAVADQVYGDQNMHDEVRKNCMNYMIKNSDYYSNYVTEDFHSYVDRKRDLTEYGNHLEMQAMAELYNRPFEVYQYATEPINTFQASHLTANPPIRVSYHQNSHYNAVIDPYKATIGVGLGLPSLNPGMVDKGMLNSALEASCEEWEQQMLNDKVQATDWESTDDAILEQVARESYMEYIEQKSSKIQEIQPKLANAKLSPPREPSASNIYSKPETPKIVKEFPKKFNRTATNSSTGDWVAEDEEWQVLSKVLANSQQEYMDALKHHATHSKATCSKYT
ncbi:OTU domain-containing protein 5-A-like [Styela clava]